MDFLLSFLPIVIYMLLIVLIIILIVLGFKLIITMNKVEKIVDNVNTQTKNINIYFFFILTTHSFRFIKSTHNHQKYNCFSD